MNNNVNNPGAIPAILLVLQIVFVILKFAGAVTWPWVWVFTPLWVGLVLLALVIIAVIIIVALDK